MLVPSFLSEETVSSKTCFITTVQDGNSTAKDLPLQTAELDPRLYIWSTLEQPCHPYLRLLLGLVLRVKEKRHVSHERGCQFREIQLWDLIGLELLLELHRCKVLLKGLAQSEGTAHNLRFILGETRYTHKAPN